MGSWFSTVRPQFAQRMPWITSEVIHEDEAELKELPLSSTEKDTHDELVQFAFDSSSSERSLSQHVVLPEDHTCTTRCGFSSTRCGACRR